MGFIVQYYNDRDDLPELLAALENEWVVVLFARADDLARIDTKLEKRVLPEPSKGLWNRLVNVMYSMAGNIPTSYRTFRFWHFRRMARAESSLVQFFRKAQLACRILSGGPFSFDRYLRTITLNRSVALDDIDIIFAMTDVYDVNVLAQITESDKPFLNYVYSWDHAGKYTRFSKKNTRYLVWHDGIKDDLTELHGIDAKNINVIGSTQLAILDDYIINTDIADKPIQKEPYVYYAGTMGYPEATEQELRAVKFLAHVLKTVAPETKLLFRPYPNVKMISQYRELSNLKNVELENIVISEGSVTFVRDRPEDKYSKIEEAALFVHMGSTIGLEAAYLNTPVLYLVMDDFDYGYPANSVHHIRNTFSQRHLEKYFLSSETSNVIRSSGDLAEVLKTGIENPKILMSYNKEITAAIPLASIQRIAARISEIGRASIDVQEVPTLEAVGGDTSA